MNLITFYREELKNNILILDDARSTHIIQTLRSEKGDELKVGEINANIGKATIEGINGNKVTLEIKELNQKPYNRGVSIVMALPRPQTIKKVLELAGVFSINNLTFINSKKVEKSYFSSSVLKEIDTYLIKGMQQGVKTTKTRVEISNSFYDGLAKVIEQNEDSKKFIADLYNDNKIKSADLKSEILLAIGPEGGWVDTEIQHFQDNSFESITLSSSILRVEQAVCAAISQIELLS